MTAATGDIRRRMKTVESTEHITNAMALVSAAKFRKSKVRYDQLRSTLKQITGRMEQLLSALETDQDASQEANQEKEGEQIGGTALVVMTSSRGLCGGYNSSILRQVAEITSHFDDVDGSSEGMPIVSLIAIGERGSAHFRSQGWNLLAEFEEGPEKFRMQEAADLTDCLMKAWESGRICRILLVGMKYINTLRQEVTVQPIWPVEPEGTCHEEMECLPSKSDLSQYLLPKYLQLTLYLAAQEAAVCEHAARRTAMEGAADSARDMLSSLSLIRNQVRQQAITDELIEIISGAESLK